MKKKLISALLATVMVASLMACGNSGKTQDEAVSSENQQIESVEQKDTEPESEVQEEIDPDAPYEETVTITIGHKEYPNVPYEGNDNMHDNPWIREYKERYNIDLKIAFAEASAEYATKVNLAIAENNLPDVFMVNVSQLDQLMEADLLYDLTEVFDTYACDAIKSYAENDMITFESAMKDGRLYAIPQFSSGFLSQIEHVFIRNDWKDALGLQDPETMEDVINIAKAFMEEYDAYGIGTSYSLSELYNLAPAWGAYPNLWIETEDGTIEFGTIQPEMKAALAEWAEWYKEGILNQDFATTDAVKLNEDTLNGKVGVYGWGQAWGWAPGASMVEENGVESYFVPYEIPSATGNEVMHPLSSNSSNFIVVSKDCEHPEAIMKMLNLHELVRYDADFATEEPELRASLYDDQMQHYPQVLRVLSNTYEMFALYELRDALSANDPGSLDAAILERYNECAKFTEEGAKEGLGRFLQVKAFTIADDIIQTGKTIENKVWGVQTETMKQSGTILSDILVEGFTKIIMGDEPIDYFDDLVKAWETAGGEQMTKEVNDYYAK